MKEWLQRSPLVAILRGVRPEEVEAIVEALVEKGVQIAEVPLNSPDPFESISRLARRFGRDVLTGAGTVLSASDAARVANAGGRLIVTPNADPTVVREAKSQGMMVAAGMYTPTEAFAMLQAGADALKIFPADTLGAGHLKAMMAVIPAGTPVLPVGGIDAANMGDWLAAGAAGFGIGGSIYKPGDSAATVGQKARLLMEGLRQSRS